MHKYNFKNNHYEKRINVNFWASRGKNWVLKTDLKYYLSVNCNIEWKWSVSCLVVSYSLQTHGLYPTRILCLQDSPGKNTGVGCHFLLQGNFLTQGLNSHLLHWQVNSLPLSHLRSPHMLIIHSITITHDLAKLETQKIVQVEKMKSYFYIFLMTHWKKKW